MRKNQRGVAAVEFALFVTVLMGFVALAGPLVMAFNQQLALGRAAGATLRYATAVPDERRYDCDGNYIGGRRPTAAQVVREAECQIAGVTATVSPEPRGSLPGTEIRVTLTKRVSLGVVGAVLDKPSVRLGTTTTGVLE